MRLTIAASGASGQARKTQGRGRLVSSTRRRFVFVTTVISPIDKQIALARIVLERM
jgi:hypothetical protein